MLGLAISRYAKYEWDNVASYFIADECLDYAINNKLTAFINCQNFYNLLYREEEREMMPLLKYLGVGSTPWSPMAKGRKFLLLDV